MNLFYVKQVLFQNKKLLKKLLGDFLIVGSVYREKLEVNDVDLLSTKFRKTKIRCFVIDNRLYKKINFKIDGVKFHVYVCKKKYFHHFMFIMKGPSKLYVSLLKHAKNKGLTLTHFGIINKIITNAESKILKEKLIPSVYKSEKQICKILGIKKLSKKIRILFEKNLITFASLVDKP